jgi:hypothetical protein
MAFVDLEISPNLLGQEPQGARKLVERRGTKSNFGIF